MTEKEKMERLTLALNEVWHKNPPLESFEPLDQVETEIGAHLPANYKGFLQFYSNGGEGSLRRGYLTLRKAEELVEWRRAYKMHQWAPRILFFAQDGDEIFGFDLTRGRAGSDYPVVKGSVASRDPSEFEDVGDNFVDFMHQRACQPHRESATRIDFGFGCLFRHRHRSALGE